MGQNLILIQNQFGQKWFARKYFCTQQKCWSTKILNKKSGRKDMDSKFSQQNCSAWLRLKMNTKFGFKHPPPPNFRFPQHNTLNPKPYGGENQH